MTDMGIIAAGVISALIGVIIHRFQITHIRTELRELRSDMQILTEKVRRIVGLF